MVPITPELITTWAGSIAAAIGVVGVALKKAGVMTLHKKGQGPKPKDCPAPKGLCGPCEEYPMVNKRVTDVEKAVERMAESLHQITQDLAYIRGKIEHLT